MTLAAILALISMLGEIYLKSGGPKAVNNWLNEKLTELKGIRDSLSGPDAPNPNT